MSFSPLKDLAPSSLKGLTRKRAYSRMSEAYIATSWTRRILTALAILGVLSLVLIQTLPEQMVSVLIGVSVLLLIVHITLRYPNVLKVVAVWFINAVVTATTATTVIYIYQGINEQFWNLITWMTAFLTGSLIILFWNLRYARGKIWFTLVLAYSAVQLSSLIGISLLWNPVATASLSTAIGLAVVFVRYVFPRRKKMLAKLPQEQTPESAQKFITMMSEKERVRFHVLTIHGRPFVVGVSPYGHVYMIELVKIDKPFTDEEGEPRYKGMPIAGWLADSYLKAQDILPKGTPFIHIIAPEDSYVKKVQMIELTPRNSVTGKTYTSFIISQKGFQSALHKLTKDKGKNFTPATSKQLRALKKKFTQTSS